nr:MAG TPA: hypothetical protein [Bacteriophage sp.]
MLYLINGIACLSSRCIFQMLSLLRYYANN